MLVWLCLLSLLRAHAFVANPDRCANCHTEQFQFWQNTHHASAYLVLYSKGSHFDPDCIQCHTLGFSAKGGFSSMVEPIKLKVKKPCGPKKTWVECFLEGVFEGQPKGPLDSRVDPGRYQEIKKRYHQRRGEIKENVIRDFMNVQCEHCHGDRERHLRTGQRLGVKIMEKTCVGCHTPERDPGFTFGKVKRVACPLMKKS